MDKSIHSITDFNKYLEYLCDIKDNSLIVISTKNTIGKYFMKQSGALLKKLGFQTDFIKNHKYSYVGILDKGVVIKDSLPKFGNSQKISTVTEEGIAISVYSVFFHKEMYSSIYIGDNEYSLNAQGINIVVYDYKKKEVIDSVCFDTQVHDNPVTRQRKLYTKEGLSNAYGYNVLMQKIEEQNERIGHLIDTVNLNNQKFEMLLWAIFNKDGETLNQSRRRFFKILPEAEEPMRTLQMGGLLLLKYFNKFCVDNNVSYWCFFGTLLGAQRHGGFIPWDDDIDVCMLREEFHKLQRALENESSFKLVESFKAIGPSRKHFVKKYYFTPIKFYKKYRFYIDIFIFDIGDKNVKNNVDDLNNLRKNFFSHYWRKKLVKAPLVGSRHEVEVRKGEKEFDIYEKYFQGYKEKADELCGDRFKKDYIVWAIDNANYYFGRRRIIDYDMIFPLRKIQFEDIEVFAPNKIEESLTFIYDDWLSMPGDMHVHFSKSDELIGMIEDFIHDYAF